MAVGRNNIDYNKYTICYFVVLLFVSVKKSTSVENLTLSTASSDEWSYWQLFWTFLKIGSTAFGGFMALISVVQNYAVERKKLLTQEEMLDGISLATILPGPVAVNVVAYVGYKARGLAGAAVCTVAVIIPSFFLILGLSYAYFSWGEIPALTNVFNGFLPAVSAIIVAAVFNMGQKTLVGKTEFSIALASMFALIVVGGFYSTLIILFLSGALGYFVFSIDNGVVTENKPKKVKVSNQLIVFSGLFGAAILATFLKSNAIIVAKLFYTFSIMSLLLFGGGFVFIPLIQEVVVGEYGWLNQKEFIDGIALGQVTPGPILISATFIGYKVAGVIGSVVATIAIFTPPAILMLVCTNFLDALKGSMVLKSILKGVRCGVIGLIAAAAYVVFSSAEENFQTFIIFAFSLFALLIYKLEVAWIIPAAGLMGYFLY